MNRTTELNSPSRATLDNRRPSLGRLLRLTPLAGDSDAAALTWFATAVAEGAERSRQGPRRVSL
ncbi:MAG: hypothetical protein RLO51_16300 [Thalassobaculum sp.]|uniref:hypothetical protein n=1 Tax=Thalassobaculum sp. TaxID=2022740 RepID=UPI0032EBCA3C